MQIGRCADIARTADRYLQAETEEKNNAKIFYAGIYLRLSIDSDYTGSDSLENQRKLAKEYADQSPELVIAKEYIDDGKTGTNFKRPAFARMISDLKQGIINCIIVKDLSRFGREYIEAGNYIEKVFPFLQARFISIVDKYDSEDPNCDRELLFISLKNLMHEMYARDISKKVGSIILMKQEKGIFYRSSTIPYGYQMNPAGENYVIDEAASIIVKQIFTQYSQGMSKYAISQMLYEKGVLTPAQYRKTGRIYKNSSNEANIWQISTIDRILKNPVYIGNLIRHKTKQSFFDGKKAIAVPEKEWVVTAGNHEGIVTESLFLNVQDRLQKIRAEYIEYRKHSDSVKETIVIESNVFTGKLFCGNCKAPMIRTVAYRRNQGELERYRVFKCNTHRKLPERCDSKYIEEKTLCEIVSIAIQKQAVLISGIRRQIEKDIRKSSKGRLEKINHEMQCLKSRQIMQHQEYIQTYAKYTRGDLSADTFQKFRQSYLEKEKFCQQQMLDLEKEEKVECFENLTESIVLHCVEQIYIFQDNRIEIKLNYQDLLENWRNGGTSDR